ncbi:Ig-like domain-containing protein [Methylobacterium segetis]|uniref:Ig-like domain-containing protein n=1 Tax=Methylobacterium segetis TaxID=2488750 RepID=UPI00104EAD74|nr:Ig-like domain-containing protein [Methylobacterium segetis]
MSLPQSSISSYNDRAKDTNLDNYPVLSLASGSAQFLGLGDANADWFVIDTAGQPEDFAGAVPKQAQITFEVIGGGRSLELGRREQTYADLSASGPNYDSSFFIRGDDASLTTTITIGSDELTTFRVFNAVGPYTINIKTTGGAPNPQPPSNPPADPSPTNPLPSNFNPNAVADIARTAPGRIVAIDVLANDSDRDGDKISFGYFADDPDHGSARYDAVSGVVIYTPNAGFTGNDTFKYVISDGRQGTATAEVLVVVSDQPALGKDVAFSPTGYLGANPDVRAAGVDPRAHYDQYGWKEGRDPSADFDTQLYLKHNPDVDQAGISPLGHYEAFGRAEGRETYAAVGQPSDINSSGFDKAYYALANPDVAAAGVDAATHYATFGWKEGRDPNAFFDTDAYLQANPDVQAAGVNPLEHYHLFGWKEGRDPTPSPEFTGLQFNAALYLEANPDVAQAGVDPLLHYLQFGASEGRTFFGD